MSLWTPDGEIPVNRRAPSSPAAEPGPERAAETGGARSAGEVLGVPNFDELSPEEQAQLEEMVTQMAEAQRQIAATPASQIVTTHAAGLYELAAIKLGQSPPMLDEARLAIDALAALLDAVGGALGPDGETLRDALRTLQMAYIELASPDR